MLIRCLALLLCIPFAALAAPPQAPSPEQVFELYVRTLLEGDTQAAETLSRVLPMTEGWTSEALSPLVNFIPNLVTAVAEDAALNDIPAPLASEFGQQVVRTYARTRCRATPDSASNDASARAAGRDATVSFRCQVPRWTIDSGLLADRAIRQKLADDDVFAMYLLTTYLREAPTQVLNGTAPIDGNADTGYFPTRFTIRAMGPVLESTMLPELPVDPAPASPAP